MKESLLNTPKLGFGCMRLPLLDEKDPTSIDIEHFKTMVDAFIEGGGTYFDTAFVYHNGTSETALREALVKRYPRDAYTVATKCLAWAAPDAATAHARGTIAWSAKVRNRWKYITSLPVWQGFRARFLRSLRGFFRYFAGFRASGPWRRRWGGPSGRR